MNSESSDQAGQPADVQVDLQTISPGNKITGLCVGAALEVARSNTSELTIGRHPICAYARELGHDVDNSKVSQRDSRSASNIPTMSLRVECHAFFAGGYRNMCTLSWVSEQLQSLGRSTKVSCLHFVLAKLPNSWWSNIVNPLVAKASFAGSQLQRCVNTVLPEPQVCRAAELAPQIMEAAADACRQGNIKQIESLPESELQRLLGKKDEDDR